MKILGQISIWFQICSGQNGPLEKEKKQKKQNSLLVCPACIYVQSWINKKFISSFADLSWTYFSQEFDSCTVFGVFLVASAMILLNQNQINTYTQSDFYWFY